MKNRVRISGILLILLMACSVSLSAQRGMHGMRNDSLYMKHDSSRMRMENRRMAIKNHDSLNRGMRNYHRMPGMATVTRHPYYGKMQRGGGPQMAYGGRGELMHRTPGMRFIENIPDLTAKQKDDLAKLRETHQGEMKKIMEKQQEEIKALRDSQRKKVMNILTNEQKKWVEENAPEDRVR